MKKSILSIILAASFLLPACHRNENSSYESAEEYKSLVDEQPVTEGSDNIEVERKLIKEGQVEFQTQDMDETRNKVLAAISKYKGYLSSDKEYKWEGRISQTLIIRVPAKDFDNLLSEATEGVGKFDTKEISVKDVTEEYLDVEARLKTKKELEARYLELLKKASSISDMLEIERQINNLRSEIESVEGRLNYLKSQVSFSTLTLTFYKETPYSDSYLDKLLESLRFGWTNFSQFILFLIRLWPFLILIPVIIMGWKRWRRNRK